MICALNNLPLIELRCRFITWSFTSTKKNVICSCDILSLSVFFWGGGHDSPCCFHLEWLFSVCMVYFQLVLLFQPVINNDCLNRSENRSEKWKMSMNIQPKSTIMESFFNVFTNPWSVFLIFTIRCEYIIIFYEKIFYFTSVKNWV